MFPHYVSGAQTAGKLDEYIQTITLWISLKFFEI